MYQWKFVSMQKLFFIARSLFFFSYDYKWKKSTSVFQIFLHVTISCSSLKTTQEVIVFVVIKLHHKCMCASHRPWVEEIVLCRSTNIYTRKHRISKYHLIWISLNQFKVYKTNTDFNKSNIWMLLCIFRNFAHLSQNLSAFLKCAATVELPWSYAQSVHWRLFIAAEDVIESHWCPQYMTTCQS